MHIFGVAKRCFNPRPCVRGDCETWLKAAAVLMFQSTPLCEGRLYITCRPHAKLASFNPRPCVRGDKLSLVL